MSYKLFGLEQKRAIKERLFKKSMVQRYRLISNIMNVAQEGSFDASDLTITFTPNLPENIIEQMDVFLKAGGELSQETLLSLLSFINDPQHEMLKLKNEKPDLSYDFQQSPQSEEVSTDE